MRKETRATEDSAAPLAHLDPHKGLEESPQCKSLDFQETKERKETEETKAYAFHMKEGSKVKWAHLDLLVSLVKMENMDLRGKEALLVYLASLAPRVKKERQDHLVMGMVNLVLLALQVLLANKEKEAILVLRENLVYQDETSKGLVESRVRKEALE